eukprot:8009003-Alexandrium_andersonii.AAC.1
MQALSAGRADPEVRVAERRAAYDMIVFCALVARWQLRRGAWFLLEQPWASEAWSFDILRDLYDLPGVRRVRVDLCCLLYTSDAAADMQCVDP